MISDSAGPNVKTGDMATHGGDIRLIDKLFAKLARGDREGLERSLRNKSVSSLRRRGVLAVERTTQ